MTMEYFDIIDEQGNKTGEQRLRSDVHKYGFGHRAVHIFIWRIKDQQKQMLLQKRAATKDSFPSCYDMSCAGHVSANDEYEESAIRELQEELGLFIDKTQLIPLFLYRIQYQKVFHNQLFIENELNQVYAYELKEDVHFQLQKEEVESVCWVNFNELESFMQNYPHCLIEDEINQVLSWVNQL